MSFLQDIPLILDSNQRSSIIGLGVYFLSSKCCHGSQIVPYLLWIENHLLDMKYVERQAGQFGEFIIDFIACKKGIRMIFFQIYQFQRFLPLLSILY